ncbi:MAG: CRISPR system precrRNA processing endoribonuclease RAMP protein Cas6 [Bacteroidetes bacterium]|nr:MAG: CRISPR system precrRNA processing endoribonuclease RAMP protein Cas6 [Bacteroidota bacterium]
MRVPFSLSWQSLRLHYRVETPGWVGRYKGSAWRGMWGHALRNLQLSWYYELFENKLSPQHPLGRRMRQGPVPYVIHVPDQDERVHQGQELEIQLTLIGRAQARAGDLEPIFQRMGTDWGPSRVRTRWLGVETDPVVHWHSEAPLPLSFPLRVDFETPWVTRGGARPTVDELVATAAERLGWLSYFFADGSMPGAAQPWRELAGEIPVLAGDFAPQPETRFSARQHRKMVLPGWLGNWTFASLPPEIVPLILALPVLGIGKGAAWGMGQLRLSVGSP